MAVVCSPVFILYLHVTSSDRSLLLPDRDRQFMHHGALCGSDGAGALGVR